MQGPSYFSLISLIILPVFLTWASYRLLARRAAFYRQPWVGYSYWLLSLSAMAVLFASRWLRLGNIAQSAWFSLLMHAAYAWLAAELLMLIVLLLAAALEWITIRRRPKTAADGGTVNLTRREFLQSGLIALPAVAFGVSAGSIYQTQVTLAVNRLNLFFPQLPDGANNLTIAQISDTHIGPFFSIDRLDTVLRAVANNKPDLVVITGDLIDDLNLLPAAMERLSNFQRIIPQGVYFCWGNHEYFRDIKRVRAALAASPITVLENSTYRLISGERPFCLIGVDYPWARNKQEQALKRRQLLDKACGNLPVDAFSVLLTHHPDFIEDAFARNIPLAMAGHTHGGQISLFGRSLLPVQYRYMRGLYQQNGLYGYVNSGTGHWLPLRIGCPAEVTIYTLRKGEQLL